MVKKATNHVIDKKSTKSVSKKSSKKVVAKSNFNYASTADIPVPKNLIDQVIGQDHAVEVMKKAALQRRHVLLIGEPGTGKSLLGLALAELIPKEKLVDILSFKNPNDENKPLIRTVPAKQGRELVAKAKMESANSLKGQNIIFLVLAIVAMLSPWGVRSYYASTDGLVVASIMFAATFLGGLVFLVALVLMVNMSKKSAGNSISVPKLVVDNFDNTTAPFFDATGAHAGALLGDVLHDPFQSGGLGTPAHERVIGGMIHKAHMGVLFIDEVATLHPTTQQELLTAIQEGRFSITGQSERSAGAMVRTEAVPCKFILIAAGNIDGLKDLHPALRSRIRGYGYEIYMKDVMEDTLENQYKIAQFVAQEVRKDGKIPHFSKTAVEYLVNEARRMASKKNHLTLRLRELGGLVRSAGDIAHEQNSKFVEITHIIAARSLARGLEQQLADRYIENKKDYEVLVTTGTRIGRVNGLAVLGNGSSLSGIVLPIESEVVPCAREPKVIATGKLGEIAKEAITNVSALVRKYFGEDVKAMYDIYVQFLQTYEGVEGDSASLAVATAMISALKNIPIKQNYAITGSVSVRGETLPVGGVSAKIEAAIDTGMTHVIVPKSNIQDIVIDKDRLNKITIIPVENVIQVLEHILDWNGDKKTLAKIKSMKK
ncbi:ATP-dependent protease LonB [Candidatus Woesearchaeota archaeon]|nr:ATP-dependent protease LonB [Candidatus Woesearchaeota archaeon]